MDEVMRLLIMARSNRPAAQRLLEKSPECLSWRSSSDNTALHLACWFGYRDVIEFLLERGAELEARNLAEETPLGVACSRGKAEIVDLLLARGADPSARDRQQRSLLHLACAAGCAATARRLLEAGLKVDATDELGFTPLFHALQVVSPHFATLSRSWAEQQQAGVTPPPVDYAREQERRLEVLAVLLEAGADLEHVGACDQRPLHRAGEVADLCPELALLLLSRGADPSQRDSNGDRAADRLPPGVAAAVRAAFGTT